MADSTTETRFEPPVIRLSDELRAWDLYYAHATQVSGLGMCHGDRVTIAAGVADLMLAERRKRDEINRVSAGEQVIGATK